MLQEANVGLTEMAMDQGKNRFLGDENLLVRFFMHPKLDKNESTIAGRPIYKDTEYVQIMVPGDKDSIVIRPTRQMDKDRFPKHYLAFKNNEGDVVEGTPLEAWPQITRAQVEELKYFNIRTVEQLASVSDGKSMNFMGINILKKAASVFIDQAKDGAAAAQLATELESRDSEIAALQEAVKEQGQRIEALLAKEE